MAILSWLLVVFNSSLPAQESLHPVDYLIDTQASILRVYVGRAGVLAGMGHNHVIVNHHLRGMITTDDARYLRQARLIIPAQNFSIDITEERQRAGSGFESMPTEKDRTATRNNMLGPSLLNAVVHPNILVSVNPPVQDEGDIFYPVSLSLAGMDIKLTIPAVAHVSPDRISVESHFVLKHHELGLEPYSVLGGMLSVADDIRFELILEAHRLPREVDHNEIRHIQSRPG